MCMISFSAETRMLNSPTAKHFQTGICEIKFVLFTQYCENIIACSGN